METVDVVTTSTPLHTPTLPPIQPTHPPPHSHTPSHPTHPPRSPPESPAGYRAGGWGRQRGAGRVTERGVLAGRQLDKAALWLQHWDMATRCRILEALSRCSETAQGRLLLTVTQPWLHRDLMYWGHAHFPHLPFQPLSTHVSRKVKERARTQERPGLYRLDSCYPQTDHPSPCPPSLPSLSPHTTTPATPTSRRTEAPSIHVRRHIQNESCPQAVPDTSPEASLEGALVVKRSKTQKSWSHSKGHALPPQAQQLLSWYLQHWNEAEKQTFLYQLLLSLDPREHYFLSACLMIRQHVDFLTQLPERLALHVLSFFSPRDLAIVSRVSRSWRRLADHNSLWQTKCREIKLEVPVSDNPVWKRVFRDNHLLPIHWGQGRCRVTEFVGHKLSVLAVCLDKWRVASGSADSTVRVWDIATGKRLHVLTGHSKGVWCLQFFTHHLLLSGSYDSTIRMWNLRSGSLCRTLLGHSGPVWCLAIHGNCLVSGSNDKTAKVWEIGRCVLTLSLQGHKATVFTVDLSHSGDTVYTGSADRTVRLWERQTGQCLRRIRVSGKAAIMSLSVSHGYFACCHGSSVCLYKGTTLIASFKEHKQRVETVKLRVDPETEEGLIVSGAQDGLCKYWDIHRPDSSLQTLTHKDSVNCIHLDEVRILTASHDHKIRLWDFVF